MIQNKILLAMYIHNTTFNISVSSLSLWKQWAKNSYIKKSMNSGLFFDHSILRVHFDNNEQEEIITIQLKSRNKESCNLFDSKHLPNFKQELFMAFGEKALFFTTHLEEIAF